MGLIRPGVKWGNIRVEWVELTDIWLDFGYICHFSATLTFKQALRTLLKVKFRTFSEFSVFRTFSAFSTTQWEHLSFPSKKGKNYRIHIF